MTRRISKLLGAALSAAALDAGWNVNAVEYYVDQKHPRSAESNPGTEELPFKTISNACDAAQAGDTVYIKAGTYREALIPKHSGAKGKPITFQAYKKDFVMIKGSEVLTDLEREGTNLWVKRPWTRECAFYDEALFRWVSVAPYKSSAYMEQVFINEEPMQWVPSRKDLKPGCFYWKGDKKGKEGELAICPPEGVADLGQALVEVPVLPSVVAAWTKDLQGLAQVRSLHKQRPTEDWLDPSKWPQIHYIHIKGLHFRHNFCTLNRVGVRLAGDYWLLEDCVVEYMNAGGVSACGDHDVVRNCVVSHNGQSGLYNGYGSDDSLYENCVTLYNNRKLYSTGYGGGGNNIVLTSHCTVRGLVSAFNYGPGLWYDIFNRDTLIEDCLAFGNAPANDFMYEVSWDAIFRRNVSFASRDGNAGAFFISDSATSLVEDNVAIGGNGGVNIGSGRGPRGPDDYAPWLRPEMKELTGNDNMVRRNLIVEPHRYVFSVWGAKNVGNNRIYDASSPQANNQFLDNTILCGHGSSRVEYGAEIFENPAAFDRKVALAKGNRQVSEPGQLDDAARGRLDEAFTKILNALALAEPRLDLKLTGVALDRVWSLGEESEIFGYWVREVERGSLMGRFLGVLMPARQDAASEERVRHFLLLDVSAPGSVRILDPDAKGANLWDFPPIKPRTSSALAGDKGVLSGRIEGPFALVTGLSGKARALSEVFSLSARIGGAPVKVVPEGRPFDVVASLANPFPAPMDYAVSGPGIVGKWSGVLPPLKADQRKLTLVASPLQSQLAYDMSSTRLPTIRRTVLMEVERPFMAPYRKLFTASPSDGVVNSHVGLTTIKLKSESQRAKSIYDLATGKSWKGPADVSGSVWCWWNEGGLLIHAEVVDDKIIPSEGNSSDGDCIELFIDGRKARLGEREYSAGTLHIRIPAPDPGKREWQPLKTGGAMPGGFSGRVRPTQTGYAIDAELKWTLFPELSPSTGTALRVDFALNDADSKAADGQPIRTAQLVWRGTEDDWRDASLLGYLKLDQTTELDFFEPFQPGDVVTRNGAAEWGAFTIYRPGSGAKPVRTIPVRSEGLDVNMSSFTRASMCFDAEDNFYFLDGPLNCRLQTLPAGETRSRVLFEFTYPDATQSCYGGELLSDGKDRLWMVMGKYIVNFSISGKEVTLKKKLFGAYRGGGMSLSPDGALLAVASNGEYGEGIALLDAATLEKVSQLKDDSGLIFRPPGVAFVPGETPFLAVVSRFVAADDPSAAPSALSPWKDHYGAAAFKASTKSRMHILRFDCDPGTRQLRPPAASNCADGKSFSFVGYRDPDGNVWNSAFEAVCVDAKRGRVLVGTPTPRKNGASIFSARLEDFRKGGLTLDDLTPVGGGGSAVMGIAVAP